ncbi:MAG: aminotransferase class V-fold PLP-dependent enzyme [Anaerolineaceae bacterium]|nr:aminotransferase class V-fold PLP-dependent enzyme [Anaerolineaceae bacterium]
MAVFSNPFLRLLELAFPAVQTYSNVHRGTGHFSQVSTALYERARDEVFTYFQVSPKDHEVIFLTPARLLALLKVLPSGAYQSVCADELGLSMGVCAAAVRKDALPKGVPFETGGGIVYLVTEDFVIWAEGVERFEAGTPPVLNAILLALALKMIREEGDPQLFTRPAMDQPDWAQVLAPREWPEQVGEELLRALQQAHLGGHDCPVPTEEGSRRYTNLDGAASTPTFAPIWEAFSDTLQRPAAEQEQMVSKASRIILDFFGAAETTHEIVYTCNTTEAVNFAANCLKAEDFGEVEPVIINSTMEHHSNELPWRCGGRFQLLRADVDEDGCMDLNQIEAYLREYNLERRHGNQRVVLVSVCGASNVLGTFTDIPAISDLAHRYDARLLVDGAQLSAHHPVRMVRDKIDYYVFSAHKIYAPFGSGGLILRRELGGEIVAERNRVCRRGARNAAGVVALAKSLQLLSRIGMDCIRAYEMRLTQTALAALRKLPRVEILGMSDTEKEQFTQKGPVITFNLEGFPHNLVAKELAEIGGVGARNGCFCAHMYMIDHMGVSKARTSLARQILKVKPQKLVSNIPGMVRVSFGIENEEADIDQLISTLRKIEARGCSWVNRQLAVIHEGTPFLPRTTAQDEMDRFVLEHMQKVFGAENPRE